MAIRPLLIFARVGAGRLVGAAAAGPAWLQRRNARREAHGKAPIVPPEPLSWQEGAVISWTGMRGVVTLAAAAAIPATLPDGSPFPGRPEIQAIAFLVAVGTLLVQGATLPWVIARLGVTDPDEEARRAEREEHVATVARTAATDVYRDFLASPPDGVDEAILQRTAERVRRARDMASAAAEIDARDAVGIVGDLMRDVIATQRRTVVDERDAGAPRRRGGARVPLATGPRGGGAHVPDELPALGCSACRRTSYAASSCGCRPRLRRDFSRTGLGRGASSSTSWRSTTGRSRLPTPTGTPSRSSWGPGSRWRPTCRRGRPVCSTGCAPRTPPCLPVLGICFGAQAIAAALGGSVHRLPRPRSAGSRSRRPTPSVSRPAPGWPGTRTASRRRRWPTSSRATPSGTQAFCLRRHLAVQFHPEVTPDIVEGWATSPTSRLGETGQTVAGLRELSESHAAAAAQRAERLFDGFAARAGIPPRVPR